jgi:YggT family protein
LQVATLVLRLIDLTMLVILARVVLSWIGQEQGHPVARLLVRLTEPLLAPLRALLPKRTGLDFSPVLALLALSLLRRVLGRLWT